MYSEWTRKNLEDIRKKLPNRLLLPIILHADGVSIGMNKKANATPAMLNLGWYSKELYKQDYGKMVIGYIDRLTDITEKELISHLMDLKKGLGWSRCKSKIQRFKEKIFFIFWKKVLDKINSAP